MAFYLRSGGGVRYLNAFEGGAQEDRIDGGAHQVCEHLAARLGPRVRLGQPVRAIDQTGDKAIVHADGEAGYACDAVVVAVPPILADAIEYQPALPVGRAGAGTGRGSAVKVHLVYAAPVWRDHGLSGWSVSSRGPLLSTVDDSPADGGVGVLTGFVTGAEAHRFAALSRRGPASGGARPGGTAVPRTAATDRVPRHRLGERAIQPRLLRGPVRTGRLGDRAART